MESPLVAEHSTEPVSLADRNYFLVRRLHSLLGLVPIGAFVCFHLVSNSAILFGAKSFEDTVGRIQLLEPFLLPVELAFIFLPLLFHGMLGLVIIFSGNSNVQQYRHGANIRYTLQRITGIIAFIFIAYHVWQMHKFGKPFGGGAFDRDNAAASTAEAIQSAWWIAPFYFAGVVSTVYHLANGIWTALITWGITIRPRSQQVSGYVCTALGIVLSVVGVAALNGFRTFAADDMVRALAVEETGGTEHHATGR